VDGREEAVGVVEGEMSELREEAKWMVPLS